MSVTTYASLAARWWSTHLLGGVTAPARLQQTLESRFTAALLRRPEPLHLSPVPDLYAAEFSTPARNLLLQVAFEFSLPPHSFAPAYLRLSRDEPPLLKTAVGQSWQRLSQTEDGAQVLTPDETLDGRILETLPIGTLVARHPLGWGRYDARNPEHCGRLGGLAATSANVGETLRVHKQGAFHLNGWNLVAGADYFAGPAGRLVTADQGLAFSHLVGQALTPNLLFFDPQPVFIL